jgi:endoglucanase
MRKQWLMASVAILCVAGCSSGGGSSSSTAAPAPTPAPAPAPTPTPSPTPIPTPAPFAATAAALPTTGATLRLGKCVNMSDMLEAPNEGDWGRGILDSDITNIKAKGFTAIRLPARFSAHALTAAPYTIDPVFMARVKHVTDLAVANNMSVIVDMHHYLELFDDPSGNATRFAEMWRQIGVAFKDEPASVYFELINEPNTNLTAANLLAIQTPALTAVRASNPTRRVVIDGANYASLDSMLTSPFPADPNIVPTFHYYDPANFGFDTAPWMTSAVRLDFGTPADIADLRTVLTKLTNYMATTGRVPFAGEYGAHESKPVAERAKYYSLVSAAFASVGVQSCAWGYTNTFHLWRDATGWEPGLADGIVTTTTLPPG